MVPACNSRAAKLWNYSRFPVFDVYQRGHWNGNCFIIYLTVIVLKNYDNLIQPNTCQFRKWAVFEKKIYKNNQKRKDEINLNNVSALR